MKFTIKLEQFLKLLNPLQSVINDNHLVPILKSVKIELTKKEIKVTGNNLEVETLNFDILKTDLETSFCVNFSMLLTTLKSLKDESIEVYIKTNRIDLIHSKGVFELPTESSKEFPKTESNNFKKSVELEGLSFKNALKVANKFVASEDLEAMSNVSVSIGKKVFIRSTDRNRLFEEKIKGKGDVGNLLISGKASLSLFALVEDSEVKMMFNDNKIFFKFNNTEIFIVQQQGVYPEAMFKQILTTVEVADEIEVNFDELLESLKRVSILSNREKYSGVRMNFYKKDLKISWEGELSSSKMEESLKIKFKKDMLLGYNPKYLIEILGVFSNKSKLFINSQNCFCLKEKKKVGIIAPIKLNN